MSAFAATVIVLLVLFVFWLVRRRWRNTDTRIPDLELDFDTLDVLSLEAELEAYIAAALFDNRGRDIGDGYEPEHLTRRARKLMRNDLVSFINNADLAALAFWRENLGEGQVGYDFWLTRNYSGTGFWDRFSRGQGAQFGRNLTKTARMCGESVALFVNDDGLVELYNA